MKASDILDELLCWGGEWIKRGEMLLEMDRLGFGPAAQLSHMKSAEAATVEALRISETPDHFLRAD